MNVRKQVDPVRLQISGLSRMVAAARESTGLGVQASFIGWTIVVGIAFAASELAITYETTASVAQRVASAGMAIALAVIPYCVARATQELGRSEK